MWKWVGTALAGAGAGALLIHVFVGDAREEVVTQQERQQTRQEIRELEFDIYFDPTWNCWDPNTPECAAARERLAEYEERREELIERKDVFDAHSDEQFDRLQKETAEMRRMLGDQREELDVQMEEDFDDLGTDW